MWELAKDQSTDSAEKHESSHSADNQTSGMEKTSQRKSSILAVFGRLRRAVVTFLHIDPLIFSILFPLLLFVLLYSILPHKELRFILIMVPTVNACAAGRYSKEWSE